MVDFDPESRALFEAARHATDPLPADQASIRRALAAKLSVAGGAIGAPGIAHGAAKATSFFAKGAKIAAVWKVVPISLAVALGGGAALHYELRPAHVRPGSDIAAPAEPRPPLTRTEAPSTATPSGETEASPPELGAVAKPVSPVRRRPLPSTAPEAATSSLGDEIAMLSQMHEAWRAGDLDTVGRLVAEHEHRFPHGVLSEEREALQVMLACRRGDADRAVRLGADFVGRHPGSPHLGRIEAACAKK